MTKIEIQEFEKLSEVENFPLRFAVARYYETADENTGETVRKQARKYFGFNNLPDFLTWRKINSEKEIHEITTCGIQGSYTRLFLDIDCKKSILAPTGFDYSEVIEAVKDAIHMYLIHFGYSDFIDYVELISHRAEKYSTHLIYNKVLINSEHIKHIMGDIYEIVKSNFREIGIPEELSEIVDMQVYSKNHTLRCHLSKKDGAYPFINKRRNEAFDENSLITLPYGENEKRGLAFIDCDCGNVKPQRQEVVLNGDLVKMAEDIFTAGEYNATIRNSRGNIINLNQDHGKSCYVCGVKHQSENLFMFVNNSGVFMKCRRNAGMVKKIHEFNFRRELQIHETISEDYLPDLAEYINNNYMLFVKSKMGTGKSTQEVKYIKNNSDKCEYAVSIVSRCSLRDAQREIFEDLGFHFYNDKDGEIKLSKYKRVVIQWESLHRLTLDVDHEILKNALIVFLDEVNSLIRQTLSGLNKRFSHENDITFEELMKYRAVAFDGLLTEETIDAVKALRPDKTHFTLFNNCPKKLRANVHRISQNDFIDSIINCLNMDEKIYIATASGVAFCTSLEKQINEKCINKKILVIHGEKSDAEKLEAVSDVNNKWVQYDCVISSPVITAGIDFTAEHFDRMFLYAGSMSSGSEDQLQSLFRVRKVKKNDYTICVDKCRKISLPLNYEATFSVEEKRLYCNSSKFVDNNFALVKQGNMKMFRYPDDPLLKFRISSITADNITHANTEAGIMDYFREQECIIDNDPPVKLTVKVYGFDKLKKEVSKKIKDDKYEGVAKAREISREEFNALKTAKQTVEDKYASEKFIMRERFLWRGKITPAFVKTYSNKDIIRMWYSAHIRDLDISQVASINDIEINGTPVHNLINFNNYVIERKICDDLRKYIDYGNKEGFTQEEIRDKLFEYIKNVEAKYSDIFPMIRGVNVAEKVIPKVNQLLKTFGYKIMACDKTKNKVRTKTYKVQDIIGNYFQVINSINEGNEGGKLPKIYIRKF